MPIYEYRRPDGSTFELQQSFSDDPLTVDPDTGVPVERVLHPPAVHFKGKGFYSTDYGSKNRARETAAASAAEKSSSEKSSEKSSPQKSSDAGSSASSSSSDTGGKGSAKASGSKPVAAKG